MIEINIDPNIAVFGDLVLAWHGIFTAVGILAGVWLAAHVMRGYGLSDGPVYDATIIAVPSAIVGARILFVAGNWGQFSDNYLDAILIYKGGISVWGAVLGGILGGLFHALRKKTPLAEFADAAGMGLFFGMAIGRIGDIINGEHRGSPTDAPWSVRYTHPDTLGEIGRSVHLAVGYEMVWDLFFVGLLLILLRRVRVRGAVFWLFLILYAVGRIWTHEFRTDGGQVLGLQEAQFLGLVTLAIAVPSLLWVLWTARKRPPLAGDDIADTSTPTKETSIPEAAN
ncbi:MAG: prolipoprotein diacylglyceryl transferase [Chloroflexota bacterium]|nr:prolipoprotein diacylglyceryl transferase [Chloroflexota bacterium]